MKTSSNNDVKPVTLMSLARMLNNPCISNPWKRNRPLFRANMPEGTCPGVSRRLRELRRLRLGTVCLLLGLTLLVVAPARAATKLVQLSLEELMSLEITSVSKKTQKLSRTAAAVYVITQEEIRRSGMTSIPELLRLAPGIQVARIDANKWAISSRGFNSQRANKLLVLMDGRTLYTPLFSGVYWDNQDTAIEDIERIEVIRGPGGTIWGANAVNGVINIITRHSRDTQGGLVAALAGNQEKMATVRYGGAIGEDGWFRAYARATDYENYVVANGDDNHDAWKNQQAGFRADWKLHASDDLTLQGDVYEADADTITGVLDNVFSSLQSHEDNVDMNGANLLMKWRHSLAQNSEWELQAYIDHTTSQDLSIQQTINTYDLDFQHRFNVTGNQELTWGLGYRYIEDDIVGSYTVDFDPAARDQDLLSVFIQDEVRLQDDLTLSLGIKLENNDYTGSEYQPSIRLNWLVDDNQAIWGALSRAVRTPSRSDRDIRINVTTFSSPFVDPDGPGPLSPGDPTLLSIFGSDEFDSEKQTTIELGYRGQFSNDFSLDTTLFYNHYDDLSTSERSFAVEGTPPTHGLVASTFDNLMQGESYGMEVMTVWQASSDWRLRASYSLLMLNMRLDAGSTDVSSKNDREGSSPKHQLQLRSYWDISEQLELDSALYYVDAVNLPDENAGSIHIPAYTRLDLRLGWHMQKELELSVVGQNLLDSQYPEFYSREMSLSAEVPRALYARVELHF